MNVIEAIACLPGCAIDLIRIDEIRAAQPKIDRPVARIDRHAQRIHTVRQFVPTRREHLLLLAAAVTVLIVNY